MNNMALPIPEAGENKHEFIKRCMLNSNMRLEFTDRDHRLEMCEELYNDSKSVDMLCYEVDDYHV